MRGLCVCLSKHPHHRWSQESPQTIALARPCKYAETGSCKNLCHTKVTWNKSVVRPRNGQKIGVHVCDKIIPTDMCLYCNMCRIWHWHYTWFTLIDPWNCSCNATVLQHIGLTLASFCSTDETAPVKPLFWHALALHWIYVGWSMKPPLYT